MRKTPVSLTLLLGATLLVPLHASAYWIWTPDIGKWVNPAKAAKDTPEEQLSWAMTFYNEKNWARAIEEFEKLPAAFPTSRLAAEGVYYTGLCWEEKKDLAKAADAFQKLVDRYPYSDRIKEAVRHEFAIAGQFASGEKIRVLGVAALSGQEKAIEIYTNILKSAPFGSYGDEAQFKIGEVYQMQGEYEQAQKAFQAVVDEYPNSEWVNKARYQIAYCSMQASKQAQYNEQYAQRAIEEFENFKSSHPADAQSVEAEESIKALRAKNAMTVFETGSFYEKRGKLESAKIYYQEVVNKYPETPAAQTAGKRLNGLLAGDNAPKKSGFKLW